MANLPGRKGTPEQRFWKNVRKTDACWEWTASKRDRGYGQFMPKPGRPIIASRFSWELAHGSPPPAGAFVLHTCDNPSCVRPDHLFLGTHDDNMADMMAKGRAFNGGAARTHCAMGHPFSEENTRRDRRGWRKCKTCELARSLARSTTHYAAQGHGARGGAA